MTIRTDIPEYSLSGSGVRTIHFPAGARRTLRVTEASGANMGAWTHKLVVRDSAGAAAVEVTEVTVDDGAATNDRVAATFTVPARPGRYEWAFWRTDGSNDDPIAVGSFVVTAVAQQ